MRELQFQLAHTPEFVMRSDWIFVSLPLPNSHCYHQALVLDDPEKELQATVATQETGEVYTDPRMMNFQAEEEYSLQRTKLDQSDTKFNNTNQIITLVDRNSILIEDKIDKKKKKFVQGDEMESAVASIMAQEEIVENVIVGDATIVEDTPSNEDVHVKLEVGEDLYETIEDEEDKELIFKPRNHRVISIAVGDGTKSPPQKLQYKDDNIYDLPSQPKCKSRRQKKNQNLQLMPVQETSKQPEIIGTKPNEEDFDGPFMRAVDDHHFKNLCHMNANTCIHLLNQIKATLEFTANHRNLNALTQVRKKLHSIVYPYKPVEINENGKKKTYKLEQVESPPISPPLSPSSRAYNALYEQNLNAETEQNKNEQHHLPVVVNHDDSNVAYQMTVDSGNQYIHQDDLTYVTNNLTYTDDGSSYFKAEGNLVQQDGQDYVTYIQQDDGTLSYLDQQRSTPSYVQAEVETLTHQLDASVPIHKMVEIVETNDDLDIQMNNLEKLSYKRKHSGKRSSRKLNKRKRSSSSSSQLMEEIYIQTEDIHTDEQEIIIEG